MMHKLQFKAELNADDLISSKLHYIYRQTSIEFKEGESLSVIKG